ncbi:MAG TPA: rod shape-determining protein MreD, partial [Chromatiales bacterium]|nr:rod shape-determining protein MreD [Chromatiales bacterium]
RPQWATLSLIYWCLALPQRVGVFTGWALGIALDVLTGTLLGQHALGLAVVAYLALKLHQRIRVFPIWQQAAIVFVLLLVERLFSLWVMGAVHLPPPPLWYWVPPFIGMLLWPWIFAILRAVRQHYHVS